jgi:hypothetical protein
VRGTLRESECVEAAPHPNPLPVKNGARGRRDRRLAHLSFVKMIVPDAANMPPTP